MATGSEPLGEHPTTQASQTSEIVNIDIAAEGDVILVLQQMRLRVSSVILSSASTVFKAMLGPKFAEGQGQRSAGDPKEIDLHDDDLCAMIRLCRILHHQNETKDTLLTSREAVTRCVDGLFALTAVSDKYDCSDSVEVEVVIKYLLPELASTSLSLFVSHTTLLALSAVAYNIKDCRHFALFTRRLVLDVSINYSSLAGQYALEALPSMFLLLIEEQRNASWMSFRKELPKLADRKCDAYSCGATSTSFKLPAAVVGWTRSFGSADAHWPLPSKLASIRGVLSVVHNSGDTVVQLAHDCAHKQVPDQLTVTGRALRRLCYEVNKIACGICLTCLKEKLTGDEHCKHRASLESWIENHPLVQ